MAFPEGNKLFVCDFCANLNETNADMVQFNLWFKYVHRQGWSLKFI